MTQPPASEPTPAAVPAAAPAPSSMPAPNRGAKGYGTLLVVSSWLRGSDAEVIHAIATASLGHQTLIQLVLDDLSDASDYLAPHRPQVVGAMNFGADHEVEASIRRIIADIQGDLDGRVRLELVRSSQLNAAQCTDPESTVIIAVGGDGTILKGAALAHRLDIPILGINRGHVGFLAEGELDDIPEITQRMVTGAFTVERRMTIDVAIFSESEPEPIHGWCLNEVSVQNATGRGVLEALVAVDRRPVSSFGCDGVLISTPTGSTAYAFSAGGPVLWPEVEAILVVPSNAHALFAKPLVVGPSSTVAVDIETQGPAATVVLDGRRQIPASPGTRVEVVRGERAVRWVRLGTAPFADRLVRKFRLPVQGWRKRPVPGAVDPTL